MNFWQRRTGASVLMLLVVVSMLLAGCDTGSSGTGSKYGGSVTIVPAPNGVFTRNFNPFLANSSRTGTQGMIYETLLMFNRMNGNSQPWLASSYSVAKDATSITFHLRQGVKWTDGQPFTSDDVVYTLKLMQKYPALDGNSLWSTIQSVSNPDASTVTVAFKQPAVTMLWYLGGQTYIVPEHIWKNISDPSTDANPNPVGTGPFALKSFDPQLYVLGKNAHYWQPGKPYVDELRYPAYNSNTSADLLLSQGQVDWTGLYTPNINKTFVQLDPTHNHYWFPPSDVVMLYLNTAKAPFNQLAVRQALSAAIDRQKISQVAENNYDPVASPTGLVLPADQKYLNAAYANSTFSVDAAKATSLLEKAGYKKGANGMFVGQDGKPLAFKINVVAGWTDWLTASQIMASDFKAIGIDATVNVATFNDYISALAQGDFDTAISWTSPGPTPYFLYNSMLNSTNTAAIGQKATSNWERWNDKATDTLLNQYVSSTDEATQQQALAGLQKIMVEQLPSIPLMYGPTWYEYNTSHFVGWPDQSNPYASPAPYNAPDAELVALTIHQP
ncbi:MAG TPA: ABC transporter substrate-binding protein [Ktedonobacterales bacterium]|nr:ABC transporter substrate-binding protein [Ktedonobacterales bacterium]